MWPDVGGQRVLGLGYAMPYLRLWRDQAARCIALTPAQMGVTRWPPGLSNLSCAAEEDCLPFADLTFDRILLVHGLSSRADRWVRNIDALAEAGFRVIAADLPIGIVFWGPIVWGIIKIVMGVRNLNKARTA